MHLQPDPLTVGITCLYCCTPVLQEAPRPSPLSESFHLGPQIVTGVEVSGRLVGRPGY